MKRLLPSLAALEVFETCARYANFTRAAEELGVTQGAVSRQITALEEFLGVRLFERVRRRVVITRAGRDYADSVRAVLKQAERATRDVMDKQLGKPLHISCYSSFAAMWLAPRMSTFIDEHPDVPFKITALDHHRAFSDPNSSIDVAIHYGVASWPDALLDMLMHENIVICCSPSYKAKFRIEEYRDLMKCNVIRQTKTDAWPELFDKMAVDFPLPSYYFDQYSMVVEAAIGGLGIAAVPDFLIGRHLIAGSLVKLFDISIKSRYAYHLVYPEAKRNWKNVKSFRRWIVDQCRQT